MMARMSLDKIIKSRPTADRAKIEQTTERDIKRQASSDGHDLTDDMSGFSLSDPATGELLDPVTHQPVPPLRTR